MAGAAQPYEPGDLLAERFEIDSTAGEGGMGVVYRALDRLTGHPVAVKVIAGAMLREADRFEREAIILSKLTHPGVVRYIDHGTTGNALYLAMEWLDGEDLGKRLTRHALSWSDSVDMAQSVAGTLSEAHQLGIVHRDLKPSNLFLIGGSVHDVKVLDFGIARVLADKRATRTGTVLGTPAYMAPEQATGASHVDARADIFALGVVLFECLTGQLPFAGDDPVAMLANILLAEAPRLRERYEDIPEALDGLVARMLSKDPDERPNSAAQLQQELRSVRGVCPTIRPHISERPPSLTDTEQRLLSVLVMRRPAPMLTDVDKTLDGRFLDSAVRSLEEALVPYGARVNELVDGSLVAVLSTSAPATDLVTQIARCALVARAILPEYRIAVSTGRGLVSGRLPVGEVIDSAFRVLSSTPARGIGLDAVTTGLLGEGFVVERMDGAAALVDERRDADSERPLLGKRTPCVGRSRELATLAATLAECVDEPVARVVLITGEAGVGKSRLRRELLAQAREAVDPLEVWVARGDTLSARSPFGLLAPTLRRVCGIRDGEPVSLRQKRVRERVARNVTGEEDAQRLTQLLGQLMGVPFGDEDSPALAAARQDAVLLGDQMRRAWEDFVAAEVRAQPLLILLDDLQWGDRPSIQFIDAALRHCREAPLMIVALARPEVRDSFGELWEAHGEVEIRLGGLTKKAGRELVRHALGDQIDDAAAELLVERAQGNAFFLEELIRAVSTGGVDALPETLIAWMQSRVETLDPEARRTLRAASVFGRTFWRGGVQTLLGGSESGWLDRWFEVLIKRELVQRRPSCRFPGEIELSFRHQALRDAAYAMLTPEDLRLGHRLAGAWLERAGESDNMVLAEHFERGGAVERAREATRRGAEQALGGHDFEQAILRARRAVDLGARSGDRAALRIIEAEAHRWLGHFAEALGAAQAGHEEMEEGSAGWFRSIDELLAAIGRLGRFEEATPWIDRALGAEPSHVAFNAQIDCLCCAARLLFQAGDYDRADDLLGRIGALEKQHAGNVAPRTQAEAHRLRGAHARHRGDVAGDFAGYHAALACLERAGDERNACNARVSVGFAYIELGGFSQAERELERALAAAERMGLSTIASRARQNMALVCAARGDVERARALATAVVEESVAQGNLRFEGWTRIYLSRIALLAGDAAVSLAEAERALELTAMTPPARAGALAAAARALVRLGRHREALGLSSEASGVLEHFGGIEEFEALVRVAQCESLAACSEKTAAREAAQAGVRWLERLGATIQEPALRLSFLTVVPDNVRLRELAKELDGN